MKLTARVFFTTTLIVTTQLLISDCNCNNGLCKKPTCTSDVEKSETLIRLKNEDKNAFIKVAYDSKDIKYSCKYTNCQGCATRFTIEKNGDQIFFVYNKQYLYPDFSLRKEKPETGWNISKSDQKNQNRLYKAGNAKVSGYN